ncbi:hypothetical protein GWK47_023397 [Chionoecetes opilio]|uniref:Uncharacterized protein n=1 Tax=Chionoecetes opilio TaxID=41210 RepID=A0A8J4XMI0_CHIOP|nr:hypothetical protein GWK47_023397 [Chionoecetes opilio]
MLPILSSLLLALHVLTAAVTPSVGATCSSGGEKTVAVDGWPVLAALRLPVRAKSVMKLSLSDGDKEHTHLTLTHTSLEDKVGVLQAELNSQMAAHVAISTAALLPDSVWASLTIVAQHNMKLELKIESKTRWNTYSTRASLNITHHLHVSQVVCSGQGCDSYIDLQCRYGKNKHNNKPKAARNKSTSDHAVYYWTLYVLMTFLVMACLLFLVWRNERNKFRTRWSRHSQVVRTATTSVDREENSLQDAERREVVVWLPGTNDGHCNLAYDATGDTGTRI